MGKRSEKDRSEVIGQRSGDKLKSVMSYEL
jgi:hypothetical protein